MGKKLNEIGHSENRYFSPEDVKKRLENSGFKMVPVRLSGFFLQIFYDNYIYRLIIAGIALVIRKWSQDRRPLKTESRNSTSFLGRLLKIGILFNNSLALQFVRILTLPDKILERLRYSACFYIWGEK